MPRVAPSRACVATLGSFDGLHKGHQHILSLVHTIAVETSLEPTLITFYPHPRVVLERTSARPLQSRSQFLEKLADAGIARCEYVHFTPELRTVPWDIFCQKLLIDRFNVRHLIVGVDAKLGSRGEGTVERLRTIFSGSRSITVVDDVSISAGRISSGRLRTLLSEGRCSELSELLGYDYTIEGRVFSGNARGRTLGFPTINVASQQQLPRLGVYAVLLQYQQKQYPGVANVGIRPTFEGDSDPRIEVHCLDKVPQIPYGAKARVGLRSFLREEKRFDGVGDLVTQIGIDCAEARKILL